MKACQINDVGILASYVGKNHKYLLVLPHILVGRLMQYMKKIISWKLQDIF